MAPSAPPLQPCALARLPSISDDADIGDVCDEGMENTPLREVGIHHRPMIPRIQPGLFSQDFKHPVSRSIERTWAAYMDDLLNSVSPTSADPQRQQMAPPLSTTEPAAVQQRAWTTIEEHRQDGPFSARAPPLGMRRPMPQKDGTSSARAAPSEAQQPPASSSDSTWPSLGMRLPGQQNQRPETAHSIPRGPGGLLVPVQAPPARTPRRPSSSPPPPQDPQIKGGRECTSPLEGQAEKSQLLETLGLNNLLGW